MESPRDGGASSTLSETALWGLGRIGSQMAQDTLWDFLQPKYDQTQINMRWLGQLIRLPNRDAWHSLEIAITDYNQRILDWVIQTMAALGQERLVSYLYRVLESTDLRIRANAVEALASLPQRRFVTPILPMLESMVQPSTMPRSTVDATQSDAEVAQDILRQVVQADDVWLRAAAYHVTEVLGAPIAENSEHTAIRLEVDMNRMLSLKRVTLFATLPLDTLLALNAVLAAEDYVQGEIIFHEQSRGTAMYIVQSGTVLIRQDERVLGHCQAADYFGEMALIDDVPRSATAIAVTDCNLLRLHQKDFYLLMQDYPEILKELCKVFAARLRRAETLMRDSDAL